MVTDKEGYMRKNVAKPITSLVVVTACFLSLITASVAWFEPNTDVRLDSGSGSTAASYFASGDGSADQPYEITLPIHLYNLAWLQYLGQFNTKEAPIYFKLGDDIDMSSFGSALPPVGTESEPFIGVFDGGGYTISNLTVSDNITDNGGDISIKPNTVTSVTGCSVIGFFGIVGDPSNLALTNFSKDSNLDYSESSISNFYLENAAVESTASNTLIGVVAGYVGSGGSVKDIGVKNGSIEVANGATGLNTTYGNTISKFSLIGDSEDKEWKTAYSSGGGGSGTGNNWGGSIDTTGLVKRLYYIAGVSNVGSTTYSSNEAVNFENEKAPSYDKGKYNAYFRSVNDGSYIWNSTSGTNQYLYEGTYLPLNIDTTTAFAGEEVEATASGVSNWKTTEYYKDHTTEYGLISNSNTGYIVGGGIPTTTGGSPTGTSAKYIFLRKETNFLSNLANSFSSSEYGKDSVKIYTVDTATNSTSSQITSSNGFQRYSTVKSNFDTMMSGTKTYCFAIRFQSIDATDSKNWSDKVTVKINGSEKYNYQFLKSAINFTVNQPGYITVIISSFMGVGTKMFDLFKIDRNSDNSIDKVTQINKIYGVANSGTYYYDDASKSSNLLFNFENTHSLNTKSLYYFEIPVNAGDYAIGKYSATEGTDTSTGYLNYLDIGANASGSDGGTSGSYSLNNVRYVHEIPLNTSTTTSYADILFVISTAAAAGDSKIYFKRDSATHLYYYVGDGTNITVTMLTLTGASSDNNASAIWTSSSSDSSSSAS